jgi:hypothetical protein
MIFIDWISTPYHKNFNRAFFDAIEITNTTCYVFSKSLVIDEVNCIELKSSENRFLRAIKVFKVCLENKNQSLFFLTYDPLFMPIIKIIKNNFFVFEHNTTPDETKSGFYKLFQKIFYKNIIRFAQFPGQYEILKNMNQFVRYLGSPLRKKKEDEIRSENDITKNQYFILPSYRAEAPNQKLIKDLIHPNSIVVKANTKNSCDDEFFKNKGVTRAEKINLENDNRNILGTFVNIESEIRGTGWYNESITHALPILICNNKTEKLFQGTFPSYPYIKIESNIDNVFFYHSLDKLRKFNNLEYIEQHNNEFNKNFLKHINCK